MVALLFPGLLSHSSSFRDLKAGLWESDKALMCKEASCGQPKGRGRPRKGWVRLEGEFADGRGPRWFCSWDCVIRVAEYERSR